MYLDLPELDLDVLKEAVLTRDELHLQQFSSVKESLTESNALSSYGEIKSTLATPSQRVLGVRGFSPPENTLRILVR